MKKSIDNFIKHFNAGFLALVVLFTTIFSGVSMPETVEASTVTTYSEKPTSSVYLYHNTSDRISYGGYVTNKYYTYDATGEFKYQAYCADPDGGAPANDTYGISYDLSAYTNSESNFEKVVYQLYGQPGYDDGGLKSIVEEVLGSTDWDGSAWSSDSYYALSHLLVSYWMLGDDINNVFYKTTDTFKNYFRTAVWHTGMTEDDLLKYALSQISVKLYQYSITVPSDFDVYVVLTQNVSSSYQLIVGTYYPQTGTTTTPDYGYIELTKKSSSTSSYSLKGAKYGVYTSSSCTNSSKVDEIEIGDDNTGTSIALETGTYYLKEIDAPEGYTLSTDVIDVDVNASSTAYVEATNTPITADITVKKTDAETGEITAQGGAELDGAIYTVYNKSGNSIYYDGKTIANNGVVTTIEIGSTGTGKASSLPYGTYMVKETSAPTGYTKDTTEYTVSITSQDGDKTVSSEDEVKRGGVKIYKLDYDTGTPEGNATLAGAEFSIINNNDNDVWYDKDGDGKVDSNELFGKGDTILTLITNSNGYASTSSDALPYGDYIIKETGTPTGYLGEGVTQRTFSISSDGIVVDMTDTSKSIRNKVKRGGVEIYKIDAETGEKNAQGDASLKGAKFEIVNNSTNEVWYDTDGDGKVDSNELFAKGDVVLTITTDKYGYASTDSDALPYGDYIIREASDGAPTGYLGTGVTSQTFSIRKDGVIVDMTAKNNSIANNVERGGATVTKVDADTLLAEAQGDASIEGAVFTIYNASDNYVLVNGVKYAAGDGTTTLSKGASNVECLDTISGSTIDIGAAIMTVTTGSDGTVSIDKSTLPYGTYVVKETSAPEGYNLSDTYYVFTVREDGEIQVFDADDEVIRGGVEIYKYCDELVSYYGDDDSVSEKQGDTSLKGAEFTIYNKSESYVMVDTDGDGTLEKYEPDEAIMTITTDETGYASTASDTLPYGTYLIKETKAPEGFLNSGTIERTFTIREEGVIVDMTPSTKSIKNTPIRGGITIYKMDEDLVNLTGADAAKSIAQGDATLEGAVYAIKNVSKKAVLVDGVLYQPGEVVKYITTDEDGMATTDTDGDGVDYTLPYGTYEIYETEVTDYGYLLSGVVNTVEIRENGKVEVLDGGEVTDDVKRQAFQIVKISADTTATEVYGVEGAEFTIYNVSDSVVTLGNNVYQTGTADYNNGTSTVNGTTYYLGDAVETITTDSTGYACSSRLSYGTYVVRETKTPTDLNTVDDFVVVIREDSTEPQVWRYFNDSPFTAYIKAIKEDSKTGQTVLISGVSFKILNTDTGEYVTQKVGEDYIDTFYTKESGYTVTPLKLECGNYELVEITAPYGYTVKDETIKFKVTTETMYEVDKDGDAVITVECINDEVTGTVTVYKHGEALTGTTTDADGNIDFVYEDEPLAGSTFAIIADEDIYTPDMQVDEYGVRTIATYNGIECYKGTVVATIVSGSDGYATAEGLPLGSYHIEEIGVTSGYTINTYVDSFTLTYVDQYTPVIYYTDSDYENERVTTDLTLTKTGDKSEELVADATYGLYAQEDIVSYFGEVLVKAGTLIETRVTDENGAIDWIADLPLGLYYVQELKAAPGTLLNNTTYYVDLSYQGAYTSVVSDTISTVNVETELDVLKLDAETGEEISGAVLQLLDESGNVLDEWTTDGTAHKIYRLIPGYYTVHEVSAPAGYVTFSDVTIKVLLTGEVQEIRVADKQTELHVSKKDAITGEELPGAILQIIDESGEVLYEWTSTDEEYVIKKIPVGTYTLHEDYTPLGYATAQDIEFTVLDTGDIQSVEMIDEIITVSITKADATTGEEISGAELTLYDAQGEIVDQWTSTDEAHIITGLYVGETYTLHEDLAPLGYATAQDVTFTIADTGEVQEVVMYDEVVPTTTTSIPKTGDSGFGGVAVALMMAILGAGCIGAAGKKKKNGKKESKCM